MATWVRCIQAEAGKKADAVSFVNIDVAQAIGVVPSLEGEGYLAMAWVDETSAMPLFKGTKEECLDWWVELLGSPIKEGGNNNDRPVSD
jgi:hypothetical protein